MKNVSQLEGLCCVRVFSANRLDLGSEATPTLQAFYYFAWSLEENMDATRKAVVAVAVFLMWQVVAAGEKTTTFAKPKER